MKDNYCIQSFNAVIFSLLYTLFYLNNSLQSRRQPLQNIKVSNLCAWLFKTVLNMIGKLFCTSIILNILVKTGVSIKNALFSFCVVIV